MPAHRHEPTDRDRKQVETLAGIGVRQDDICRVIGIASKATLHKYYRTELDAGKAKARSKVMETLFGMATSGRNFPATKYWLEQQGGDEWRYAIRIEVESLKDRAREMAAALGLDEAEALAEAEAILRETGK